MSKHMDLDLKERTTYESFSADKSGEYISPHLYKSLESMGEIVKIDVGGTTFSTTK